ncbi:hypothetical protein MYMA111404_02370 [Mycoplasma marinum]|uniref:Uncharacterized protein n=1 Tax=Mycoplasma marinum TaxID=1937190 RepID=A0A4R0XK49_9MOLU|nr:hypothetical protein [Mycoplasma marinum]TCG11013.1 hypothetical protein C4B24_03245 [Mycoplasma marinum]
MKKNNFRKMTKEERVNMYGGFSWLSLIPAATSLIQTVVGAGISIYQAVTSKSGSVSFGGSKTIIQKATPVAKATSTSKVASTAPTSGESIHERGHHIARSFTAY